MAQTLEWGEGKRSWRSGESKTCNSDDVRGRSVNEDRVSERQPSISEFCDMLDMIYFTVRRLLKEDLHLSASWVPSLLKEDETERRVVEFRRFLAGCDKEGDSVLQKIVTMDETWLFNSDPESKQQTSQWKSCVSPPPKKARAAWSMWKSMST